MLTADEQTSRPPVRGIVWGIVLNAIIPVVLYKLSRRYLSPSEFTALLVASTFPLGKNVFDVVRSGQLDPIWILVLLGIATDGVALLFGGSARLLLVRESFFTAAFGFACFVSLLFPRPIMFRALFHRRNRPAAPGAIQRGLATARGAFLPPADYECLGKHIRGRTDGSTFLDLQYVLRYGPGSLTDPARHAHHRHYDLGIQLWEASAPARHGSAQSSRQPKNCLTPFSSFVPYSDFNVSRRFSDAPQGLPG
jgi:hypothetical protein